jgi:hypothetical protein
MILFSFRFFSQKDFLSAEIVLAEYTLIVTTRRKSAGTDDSIALESEERLINTTTAELLTIFSRQLKNNAFSIDEYRTLIEDNCNCFLKMEEVIRRYLSELEADVKVQKYRPATLKIRAHQYRIFRDFLSMMQLENLAADDITQRHLEDFYLWMHRHRGLRKNSAMDISLRVVSLMKYAVEKKWLKSHRLHYIKQPKLPSTMEYLSSKELKIFEAFNDLTVHQQLIQRMFIVMTRTCMDFKTLQMLPMDALHKTYLTVQRSETAALKVPLSPQTYRLILQCSETNGSHLFRQMSMDIFCDHLNRISKKMNIGKNITSTSARLTFAHAKAIPSGMTIETISAMMGHKRINQTRHLLNYSEVPAAAEMRKVKNKLDGKH